MVTFLCNISKALTPRVVFVFAVMGCDGESPHHIMAKQEGSCEYIGAEVYQSRIGDAY